MMQVFVKTLSGKTLVVEVQADTTVSDMKMQIRDQEGVPPEQQRLIVCGVQLVVRSLVWCL
jgi:Ubiquitin family